MRYCFSSMLACLLVFAMGCKKDNKNVAHLQPSRIIDRFNDSTFFSQAIFEIETAFSSYFISDMYSAKVYRVDSALNLTEVIGRPGKGPGEFTSPMAMYSNAGNFYVADAGEIKIYREQGNRWVYREKEKVPPINSVHENNFFIVRDSSIYFASPMDYWVTRYRLADKAADAAFGERFDLQPSVDRNVMQLLDFNNSIYVIGVSEAVIYRYSYDGKLISFKDFRNEPFFQETTLHQNNYYAEDSSNGLSTIFAAAAGINNNIHITFYHRKKKDADSEYNKVLVIDADTYEIIKIYELGKGGFYTCISPSITSKNGFVTYNMKNASIELYDLD
jgi:hypothetical protein